MLPRSTGPDPHVHVAPHVRRFTTPPGLMDIGVGSFIFSGALVSPVARSSSSSSSSYSSSSSSPWGRPRSFLGMLRRQAGPIGLGVLRLVVIKCLGYQEHVSEYGTHWNFFFTVSLVAVGVWALEACHRALTSSSNITLSAQQFCLVIAAVLIGGYQAALSWGGLSEYVTLISFPL